MDTPKLIRTDERGLPTYEPHIEKQITNIFFDGMEPSPEMEQLIDPWLKARAKVIRDRNDETDVKRRNNTRLIGWKKDSTTRKNHTHETTRGNDQNSSMGPLETGAAKRKGLQGSVSGKRRKG